MRHRCAVDVDHAPDRADDCLRAPCAGPETPPSMFRCAVACACSSSFISNVAGSHGMSPPCGSSSASCRPLLNARGRSTAAFPVKDGGFGGYDALRRLTAHGARRYHRTCNRVGGRNLSARSPDDGCARLALAATFKRFPCSSMEKHNYRKFVVASKRDGGAVHDLEISRQHLRITSAGRSARLWGPSWDRPNRRRPPASPSPRPRNSSR